MKIRIFTNVADNNEMVSVEDTVRGIWRSLSDTEYFDIVDKDGNSITSIGKDVQDKGFVKAEFYPKYTDETTIKLLFVKGSFDLIKLSQIPWYYPVVDCRIVIRPKSPVKEPDLFDYKVIDAVLHSVETLPLGTRSFTEAVIRIKLDRNTEFEDIQTIKLLDLQRQELEEVDVRKFSFAEGISIYKESAWDMNYVCIKYSLLDIHQAVLDTVMNKILPRTAKVEMLIKYKDKKPLKEDKVSAKFRDLVENIDI